MPDRTCPVVQWIGIRLPMQEAWVQSRVWEDSTLSGAIKACEPQLVSPGAVTTEAHEPRVCAPQQEKPQKWKAHVPQRRIAPDTTTRESPHGATKTQCNQK